MGKQSSFTQDINLSEKSKIIRNVWRLENLTIKEGRGKKNDFDSLASLMYRKKYLSTKLYTSGNS